MRPLLVAVVVAAECVAAPAFADVLNTTALRIENVPTLNPDGGAHNLLGPTDLRFLPDGRAVITEKAGAVKLRGTDGTITVAYQFCVSTNSEQGLLGVEVDPDFNNTHRLFFYYSNCDGDGGTELDRHRVVSITLLSNGTLDPTSEKILVHNLRGPANHDGGGLAIGPDGKLYIGVGDTGCNVNCCPASNMFSSCLSNANGKILRVNLDGTIPSDNPLVGVAAVPACGTGLNNDMANGCWKPIDVSVTATPRTEIWAWGTRNPFRFSFDKMTGKLWLGDVGEAAREEIDIVQGGKHHGYPWFEGFMGPTGTPPPYDLTKCNTITPGAGNCVEPLWDCAHGDGKCQSITGGAFVDSPLFPAQYNGQYFFADNATGYFYVLHVNSTRDGVADAGAGVNPGEVLGHFNSPNNVFPCAVRVGNDGFPYYVMINIMATSTGVGRIARVVPSDWDGGTTGTGGGAGGGSGTGGGSGATGGGSGATGGGSGATGGGSGATGGGSGATGGGSGATGGGSGATGGGVAATGGGAGGGSATGGSGATGGSSATGGSGTGGGNVTQSGCNCSEADGLAQFALAALFMIRRRRRG
jgi:glucose/arabinose dehydrogenase